ncbi:hypothetical protein RhiirA4_476003 [Rhizophagus irregularis]|uniref:Uncharacterized protein n=1 Tax=Rhizophagus irregularis TaxID=588596 RepID=A0A2I1HAY1_9GLOM|nr:hypothetical protein RhiirA4_476003 [Rhizophagus irregularis]
MSSKNLQDDLDKKFFRTLRTYRVLAADISDTTGVRGEVVEVLLRSYLRYTYREYDKDTKQIGKQNARLHSWLRQAQQKKTTPRAKPKEVTVSTSKAHIKNQNGQRKMPKGKARGKKEIRKQRSAGRSYEDADRTWIIHSKSKNGSTTAPSMEGSISAFVSYKPTNSNERKSANQHEQTIVTPAIVKAEKEYSEAAKGYKNQIMELAEAARKARVDSGNAKKATEEEAKSIKQIYTPVEIHEYNIINASRSTRLLPNGRRI